MKKTLSYAAVLTALSTLAACGGGGGDAPPTTLDAPTVVATPTDALGQVTGLHTGYFATGTYTVSHCTNNTGAAVSRQLRLLDNGGVEWLDGNGNVLTRYTPTSSTQANPMQVESRQIRYTDGYTSVSNVSNWDLRYQVYQNDSNHARLQSIEASRTSVLVSYTLNGSAQSDGCSTANSDTVVTVPLALTQTLWNQRLGSMAAVSGSNGFSTTQRATNTGSVYNSLAVSTSGTITGMRLGNGGTPVADDWSNYIDMLLGNGSTAGSITEYWDNTYSNPQRPEINLVFRHTNYTTPSGTPVDLEFIVTPTSYDTNGKAVMVLGNANQPM